MVPMSSSHSAEGSLSEAERTTLLRIAADAIEHGLEGNRLTVELAPLPPALHERRATFVTLNTHGELRGCIGTLEARRPLALDVAHNAQAAAFSDPRFSPLSMAEFPTLDIHISVLSPAEPVHHENEGDLIRQLRPGIDGLILEDGYRRGTFLPAVWESLSDPHDFLHHLKLKAGMSPNYWSEGIRVFRYTTESFGESVEGLRAASRGASS